VSVAIGGVVIAIALNFGPVTSVVLALAGVNDSRVHVYQVLRPELAFSMRVAHLPVVDVRGTAGAGKPPVSFVGGYLRYSYGGIKLLCLHKCNPDDVAGLETAGPTDRASAAIGAATPQPRTGTNKLDASTSKQPNVDSKEEEAKRRLEAGDGCLSVKSEDVKLVHRDYSHN